MDTSSASSSFSFSDVGELYYFTLTADDFLCGFVGMVSTVVYKLAIWEILCWHIFFSEL